MDNCRLLYLTKLRLLLFSWIVEQIFSGKMVKVSFLPSQGLLSWNGWHILLKYCTSLCYWSWLVFTKHKATFIASVYVNTDKCSFYMYLCILNQNRSQAWRKEKGTWTAGPLDGYVVFYALVISENLDKFWQKKTPSLRAFSKQLCKVSWRQLG
jgi:hypothetical protein